MAVSDWQVRRLGQGDDGLFGAMNRLFGKVFEDAETYGAKPPSPDYVAKLLARDDVFALVIVDEGAVFGALVAYELVKFESERSEVYIYDLAVAEAQRRLGVATAMIEHLRGLAAARGAWVIYVQADHGDDPAIALYSKLGVREDVLHFDIAVNAR